MWQMLSDIYPSLLPESGIGMVWKVPLATEPVVNISQCCLAQLPDDAIDGRASIKKRYSWKISFKVPFSFECALRKSAISTLE